MVTPVNQVAIQGVTVASADYLNTLVQWVPNLAALRNFAGTGNMTVILLGLVTPNDGGQGTFVWMPTMSAAAAPDDGFNIIHVAGFTVGVWTRVVTGSPSSAVLGRLTLVSGVPVTLTDVTAATTIYYAPYRGGILPQLALPLDPDPGHVGYHVNGSVFDLFLYFNGTTWQLVSGPVWTSLTARAVEGRLSYINGFLMNREAMTARADTNVPTLTIPAGQATFVGTFRTDATTSGQTMMVMNPAPVNGGGGAFLFLWNMYNRRLTRSMVVDSGMYMYSTAAWRVANNSFGNTIHFVSGVPEDAIFSAININVEAQASDPNAWMYGAVSMDSVTVPDFGGTATITGSMSSPVNFTGTVVTHNFTPQIGSHFVSRLEYVGEGTWTMNDGVGPVSSTLEVAFWC